MLGHVIAAPAPLRRAGFLAREPSRFVGRVAELGDLEHRGRECRLVSIVGPAGVGKTRLALRHAIAVRPQYQSAGGAWFCDLRGARDVDQMSLAVASTLGIADQASRVGDEAAGAVARALLARGRALVVLDNIEQLLPAASAVVARWLDAAPAARFVVTSREPLGLLGEDLLELTPMKLPKDGATGAEAVELFVDRVRSMRGRYTPGTPELAAIGEVVRRLGGLPLAIELAASRLDRDGPEVLLPPGHSRARRGLDWAWAQLAPWERDALRQCSVFRGGFDEDAAEAVLRVPDRDVLAVLAELEQKLLLWTERRPVDDRAAALAVTEPPGRRPGVRYSLCEGLRAHAAEILELSGDADAVAWRHAAHYLGLADGLAAGTRRAADVACERENLEVVMELGVSSVRPDIVLDAAVALHAVAPSGALSRRELAWLDEALGRARGVDARLIGRALGVRAAALRGLGRLEEAARDGETALGLAHEAGDLREVAAQAAALGNVRFQLGDLAPALEHSKRALAILRSRGDRAAESAVLQQLGAVHQSLGDAPRAKSYYDAALQLAVEIGDGPGEARATIGLGSYHLEAGDLDRAHASYERGMLIAQRLGLTRSLRIVRGYLGILHFDAGLWAEAGRYLESAASASKAAGDVRVEGFFVGVRGAVLASEDEVEAAREAFAEASRLLAGNPFFLRVIEIHGGHLDLAEARRAASVGLADLAEAHVAAARSRVEAAMGPLAHRSDDARIAVRILERALSRR